ncbi:MAG: SIS domain-containing protein [Thermodesulfobacteriota bacterium]
MTSAGHWSDNVATLTRLLADLSARESTGRELDADAAFIRWRDTTLALRAARGTVYLVGNGASASMASHFAADLAKNAHVRTEVFSDLSLITAIANDLCYEEVFAEPLRRRWTAGDMLVAISSSGRSPNILRAVAEARRLSGTVVTLSAMAAGNPLRSAGDLNFYLPAETYGLAESGHAAILHHWMDLVAAGSGPGVS